MRMTPLNLALAGALGLGILASGRARAQTNEEFITELEAQAAVSWHAPALDRSLGSVTAR